MISESIPHHEVWAPPMRKKQGRCPLQDTGRWSSSVNLFLFYIFVDHLWFVNILLHSPPFPSWTLRIILRSVTPPAFAHQFFLAGLLEWNRSTSCWLCHQIMCCLLSLKSFAVFETLPLFCSRASTTCLLNATVKLFLSDIFFKGKI